MTGTPKHEDSWEECRREVSAVLAEAMRLPTED